MKWENKGNELLNFSEIWAEQKQIAIFGLGIWAKSYINNICHDITVVCIIDNNPELQGQTYNGILIISFEEYLQSYSNYKILVSTYYDQISAQLKDNKLYEDKEFCDIHKFISVWYWYNKKELHLTRINTAITTKCTLKCKYCNMFIPFYKIRENRGMDDIISDFELIFRGVDKIYAVSLLGGEPLLHPNLGEILYQLDNKFGNRISELSLITNGTILPDRQLIEIIKKCNIVVQVTDYSKIISDKNKINSFIKQLKENGITYRIVNSERWLDFGFPNNPCNIANEHAEKHMEECAPIFKGLNDKRFYYCHVLWSAAQSGLIKQEEGDFIDLEQFFLEKRDPIEILEYSLGYMDKGYLSLCQKCAGCGVSNQNYVTVGEQWNCLPVIEGK